MKKVNYAKMGYEDGKNCDAEGIRSVGGDLSCEVRLKRSFQSIMRCFDSYQEGFMRGMAANCAEAMQEFSDERRVILEDEAERIEKKVAEAKKTKKAK